MPEPRFLSIDTSQLSDNELLRYDAASHRIIGGGQSQSQPQSQPPTPQARTITGNTTLSAADVAVSLLEIRGVPSAPCTLTLPTTAFGPLTIINKTGVTLTVQRLDATLLATLAPDEGGEFYHLS